MATLAAIRDAIKATIEAAIPAVQVYPRLGKATNLPAVVAQPADSDYLLVMNRASVQWEIDLYVLASLADAELGQFALDTLIDIGGTGSLVTALFNSTLGLANTNAFVASMSNYGERFEGAGTDHMGALLRLVVTTDRTGA